MNYLMKLTFLSCLCMLISIASPSPVPSANTIIKRCTSRMQLTVPESSRSLNSLLSAHSLARNVQRWKSWLQWSSSGLSVSIHNPFQGTSTTRQSAQDHHEESATTLDTAVMKITLEASSSQDRVTPNKVPKVTKGDVSQAQTTDEDTPASQNMELEKQAYLKRSLSHVLELSDYLQQQDIH